MVSEPVYLCAKGESLPCRSYLLCQGGVHQFLWQLAPPTIMVRISKKRTDFVIQGRRRDKEKDAVSGHWSGVGGVLLQAHGVSSLPEETALHRSLRVGKQRQGWLVEKVPVSRSQDNSQGLPAGNWRSIQMDR